MAKKRFMRKAYRGARRSFSRVSRSASGLKPMDVLLAGAIYGIARPIVAKTIPDFFSFGPVDSDNVIVGTAGFFGMKKGKGIMKALGAIALGGEAGIITSRVSAGMVNNSTASETDAYQY